MFGYIKPYKPEMRIKEYELYRSFYCSMCKKLGQSYGLLARFTLNYEFVFLALLHSSLNADACPTIQKRCPFNPLKKCNYCEKTGEEFEFSSAAAIMLLYYKLLDNLRDEKGIKKLKYLPLKPLFKSNYLKAVAHYPEMDKLFSEYDSAQQRLEAANVVDIDAASEPTAVMLGELFKMCSRDETQQRILARLGYCMGRYIYILDASSDLKKDIISGAYNPLKSSEEPYELAKRQLYFSVNEATRAFELLNICKFKNILGNVITLGLEETFKKELNK